MEFVQVIKEDLLTYISYVEQLSAHHDQLEQNHKDLLDVVAIDQASTQVRQQALLDHILDNNSNKDYAKGLIDAYNIIRGGVSNNG